MSSALFKRLRVIEGNQRPRNEKRVVTCLPVNSWAKAEGDLVAPGVWYRADAHYGHDAIHYSDADSLTDWLNTRTDLAGPVYKVITSAEFEAIRADLEAQC